jgi:GNAT superfamily N-acetyltransferase
MATPSDLKAVLEIDRATPIGWGRRDLLTDRVNSGDVMIYEEGGRALGYATRRPRSFFGRDFVELLAVLEEFRRRGVATALLQEFVRNASTDRIFTSTNESNASMLALLQRNGWQLSGRLDGIDAGDPELVFYTDAV